MFTSIRLRSTRCPFLLNNAVSQKPIIASERSWFEDYFWILRAGILVRSHKQLNSRLVSSMQHYAKQKKANASTTADKH